MPGSRRLTEINGESVLISKATSVYARVAASLLLVAALLGVSVLRSADEDIAEASSASPSPRIASAALGVHHGSARPEQVDEFGAWLGRDVVVAMDYMPSETWDNIQGEAWFLDPWVAWLKVDPNRRLMMTVPALPGPADLSGPTAGINPGPVSLAAGATGAYNSHFVALAQKLVTHGIDHQVELRIGQEFNGPWSTWDAVGKEALFASYWRQFVGAMRAVPSFDAKFVWNPNLTNPYDIDAAYPGDAYVDQIGVDTFDISSSADTYPIPPGASADDTATRRAAAWDTILNNAMGLKFYSTFARAHGKPMTIPEWGVLNRADGHGGGDNPYYIERMHEFITDPQNNVTSHVYVDATKWDAEHQLSNIEQPTRFPAASARFNMLFGAEVKLSGYHIARADGTVNSFGAAPQSDVRITPTFPIVGADQAGNRAGYWLVASDGGVFAFGDAQFFGSTGATQLNKPIVALVSTPSGSGYWLIASDGGVFAYGDAGFYGSAGSLALNKPIVAASSTPTGQGYWLIASDGGVFGFGDAGFHGSTGSSPLNQPIVGATSSPTGNGYWLVASDGGMFAFGDAQFFGSLGSTKLNQPISGMTATPSGFGYLLIAKDGGLFAFGDGVFQGAEVTDGDSPAVAIAGFAVRS